MSVETMHCPLIQDLPAPPAGKVGWPWTEETPRVADHMPDGSDWPKISVVTPNYNYERYLETTIRSVLLQGYPNIEFIIQDDGSSDGSVELIKRYERHLAYWASDPNSGQPSVINRGLHRATGDILAYINSDDYYLPGAFEAVAKAFCAQPEADFIHGICRYVDDSQTKIGEQFGNITRFEQVVDLWNVWWNKRQFVQPETFWRRRIWEKTGDFRTDLYIVFDYEYWCRMLLAGATIRPLNFEVASFRFQPSQKTRDANRTSSEELAVIEKWLWDSRTPISRDIRRRLQAQWTFDSVFRKEADRSAQLGETRWKRWCRLAAVSLRHPKVFASDDFRSRIAHAVGLR